MGGSQTITYAIEQGLGPDEFVDVLKRSGLDHRRPVDKPDVIRGMVENADLPMSRPSPRGTATPGSSVSRAR